MRRGFLSFMTMTTAICAVVFFMAAPVWAEGKLELTVKDNKLSVDLVEADLVEVLNSLSEKAGIEITIGEGVSGTVTLKFTDMPLQEGLEKIIGQSDYALEYVGEGLSKVKLVNKKGEAVAAKTKDCSEIKYNKEAKLLKFLDCEEKVITEFKLSPCETAVFPKIKGVSTDKTTAGQYVVVVYPREARVNKSGKCFGYIEPSRISFFDTQGKLLWGKKYGQWRAINGGIWNPEIIIANNGERTVVQTGVGVDAPGGDEIYVYNKHGDEVLKLPQPGEEKNLIGLFRAVLSPNGRYLTVQFNTLFKVYDLINRAKGILPQEYFVFFINDVGIANVRDLSVKDEKIIKMIEIDLKDYLGRD